ncbi:MAG TPA: extracellular solute-binding protein [Pseudobacteroides sp.]|uniref:ABC transporter substrate-binding protein n=1 Tax=Pseudobacteroides sp. TaxID=1968840 RepID=UPI002F92B557
MRIIKDSDEEKIKLRFISSWGGIDPQAKPLNDILNEFMENNKYVEIINESVSGDDFLTKIKVDFASGYAPDVFGLWPGSDINAMIKAGKVADLTELLESDPDWKNSFKEDAWSYTTYDGLIYGLPFERIFEGLFINKDLFEKYNIKIPEDYEELKIAVIKFRAVGITPIALNYRSEGTYLYQNILAALGGIQVKNPINEGMVKDCYVEAMKYMKELNSLSAFPSYDQAVEMDNDARDNLFLTKKAAMIAQGSWFVGKIKENDKTVDIIPFPKINDGVSKSPTVIHGLGCGTFYVSQNAWTNSDKNEASIRLLKALTSKKAAETFSYKSGMINNLNIDTIGLKYNDLTKKGLDLIENANELVGPPDSYVDRTAWENIIVKKFPYVLEDKERAVDVWNEYLENVRMRDLIE